MPAWESFLFAKAWRPCPGHAKESVDPRPSILPIRRFPVFALRAGQAHIDWLADAEF